MRPTLVVLCLVVLVTMGMGSTITTIYNISTEKHPTGALAAQRFVDQAGKPALDTAQAFIVSSELSVTNVRATLWLVFHGPWDRLTSQQLQHTALWLLVSNGTVRYAPMHRLSLSEETILPDQIAGHGESLCFTFVLENVTLTLHAENQYYLYPEVPVPRNYDPIHSTETRVYWAQAQRSALSQSVGRLPVSLVRDTDDLLATGAAVWTTLTAELADAFGGISSDEAPVLALDLQLYCQSEVPDIPEPSPVVIPTRPHSDKLDKDESSTVQTGAAIAIAAVAIVSLLMLMVALAIWKRIREGDNETKFTRLFDGLARCTGYDPSGFANLDPPSVRAQKDRNALIGTLEAHRYEHVQIIRRDSNSFIIDEDSDSFTDMSDSDLIS